MSEGLSVPEEVLLTERTRESQLAEAEQREVLPVVDFELLYAALTKQVETAQRHFQVKHRRLLRWAQHQGYDLGFVAQGVGRVATTTALMASILTPTPQVIVGMPHVSSQEQSMEQQLQLTVQARKRQQLTVQTTRQQHQLQQQQAMTQLQALSQEGLDDTRAQTAATALTSLTGVRATAQLDGYRLNTNVGRIGWEQHLKRYPGESIDAHFASAESRRAFESSGFAPGLGAYGYFAPSAAALTETDIQRERYYVALQTFASPNWAGNARGAYEWFRYRKVIVYNPSTQRAVVADVADAGPALSTGKSFGGSPEVMVALESQDGGGQPPVMMFFVDDPQNDIPLGPLNFQVEGVSL